MSTYVGGFSAWMGGRADEGDGLENRWVKAPGVRIPPHPPDSSFKTGKVLEFVCGTIRSEWFLVARDQS